MGDFKVHTDNHDEVIDRWFANADPGDWVGVFENHDLGHYDIGRRFAAPYDADQWDRAVVGKTNGPDNQETGLGWRYLLVAKCRTAAEVKAAMLEGEVPS